MENSPLAVVEWDPDYNIIRWSEEAEHVFGWTSEEMLGKRVDDVKWVYEEDWPIVTKLMDDMNAGVRPRNVNPNRNYRKDGSVIYCEWYNSVLRDDSGEMTSVLSLILDVTERECAESAVKESEKDYRELVQNANSAILRWNNDGKITFFNEYAQQLFGYTLDQIIGQHVNILIPETDSTGTDLTVLVTEVTSKPDEYETNVNENIRSDGSRFWMNWTNRPILDENGNLVEILAIGNDITKHKQAEEALRKSEMRLNRSQSIAHLGSWELDLINNHLTWSDEVYNILGLQKQEFKVSYEAFLEIVHPDDRKAVADTYSESLREKKDSYEIEHRIIRKPSNEVRVVLERCENQHNQSGEIIRSVGMIQDITDRKLIENERETTIEFLHLVNRCKGTRELIKSSVNFFQKQSGCEAVGIRLKDNEDYPYFETHGFPKDFILLENSLCARCKNGEIERDDSGNPIMECMCGNVICGRFDASLPFFTDFGTFWTNSTSQLLASTTEADRQARTRNRCNGEGYESVALIPLSFGNERVGLLQLNDQHPGIFTPHLIASWERLAGYLAVALAKIEAEESLRESNERLAILSKSANQILTSVDPQKIIQTICEDIMTHLDCHAFFNYLVDNERNCLHLNAYSGIPDDIGKQIEWLDYGTAVCGCAARDGCRIVAENITETPDPRTELVKSFGIQAYACHPLLSHNGDVIGTLSFGTRSRNRFEEDELALMKTIADQVATTMERVRLHAEADRHAAEIESFVTNLADGVSRINQDGQIAWMNDAGREILQLPHDEIFADWMSRFKLYSLDGQPLPLEQAAGIRALKGEKVKDFRYKVITSSGSSIILSVSASPIYDAKGNVIGATSTFRDQSERVAFEDERQRNLEREHHISEVLQNAILPASVPTELMGYEIAVKYMPALNEAEIGGDFYDVFELGDGRFAIVIGDVVGKGLTAALRVAAARHAIRSYAYLDPRPARVLTLANTALCKDTGDETQLLTLFYAVVDPGLGGIMYSSAGHVPPIFCSANGTCEELLSQGLPLGVYPAYEYDQSSNRLDPGDLVVMVTDGITEARSQGIDMYGQERLLDYVKTKKDESPDILAEGIMNSALEHAGGHLHDDAAVVVLASSRAIDLDKS